MAQKRMISIQIVESYPFLSMPLSSQALYMHLVINCDDDGIVEAYKVMMVVQAKPVDLQILVAKRFCEWLDETRMIMFVSDWLKQNKIRSDRYTPSIYQELLLSKYPNSIPKIQKKILSSHNEQCQTFLPVKNADTEQVRTGKFSKEQQQTRRAHANITNNNFCQDVNFVDNSDVVAVICKKCNLNESDIKEYVAKYGENYVKTKLLLLSVQKNEKNGGAWFRAALENDYQNKNIKEAEQTIKADIDCKKCHGTGYITYVEDLTNETCKIKCICCR